MKSIKDFGLVLPQKEKYPVKEYDVNGNVIHYKDSDGVEWWKVQEGKLELKEGQYYLNGEKIYKQ